MTDEEWAQAEAGRLAEYVERATAADTFTADRLADVIVASLLKARCEARAEGFDDALELVRIWAVDHDETEVQKFLQQIKGAKR